MVSGPGSSQARFERGRSRPTSSITMAISGLLLRSRNGTALRRHACSASRGRGELRGLAGARLLLERRRAAGPARPRCICGRPGMSSMRAYFASGSAGVPRFISSSVSRASRSRSTVRAARRASSRRPGCRRTAAAKPTTMACQRWRIDPVDKSAKSPTQRSARIGGRFGLLLFAFPLLFFLDAISAISPNALACRHYFASVQSGRQNKGYNDCRADFTTRMSGSPERPLSRMKPRRLASSSILWFSRSTWPITRLTPRALA